MSNFWQSAVEHPFSFILIFIVILGGVFLFIYGLHRMFPNPVKSILDLVKVLSDEFNPKKTKNPVQKINAISSIFFAILLILILIVYFSHSLLIFVISTRKETSSQLLTTFIIALFIFFFILVSSLVLINKSIKESTLKERVKKFDNK